MSNSNKRLSNCIADCKNCWKTKLVNDGERVFVAPCKMGEPIYIVITKIPKPGFPAFTFIKRSRLTEGNFFRVLRAIGKTIFITEEEASAKKEEIERGQRTEV